MGTALIKLKIMPESPDSDLEAIKQQAQKEIEQLQGKLNNAEEQPIAFGLKALILTISIDEKTDTSVLENLFEKLNNVTSSDIIDYRRAL